MFGLHFLKVEARKYNVGSQVAYGKSVTGLGPQSVWITYKRLFFSRKLNTFRVYYLDTY